MIRGLKLTSRTSINNRLDINTVLYSLLFVRHLFQVCSCEQTSFSVRFCWMSSSIHRILNRFLFGHVGVNCVGLSVRLTRLGPRSWCGAARLTLPISPSPSCCEWQPWRRNETLFYFIFCFISSQHPSWSHLYGDEVGGETQYARGTGHRRSTRVEELVGGFEKCVSAFVSPRRVVCKYNIFDVQLRHTLICLGIQRAELCSNREELMDYGQEHETHFWQV